MAKKHDGMKMPAGDKGKIQDHASNSKKHKKDRKMKDLKKMCEGEDCMMEAHE